jgi:hypothetical protein
MEESILLQKTMEIVNIVYKKWLPVFNSHSYQIHAPAIRFYSKGDSYFLEVEDYFFQDNNVEVFNLIIVLQGETLIEINELESEVNNEFERIFLEMNSSNSNLQ